MMQSKSPYYQPTTKAPIPFQGHLVGSFSGDPDYSCKSTDEFNGCDSSWAVLIRGC